MALHGKNSAGGSKLPTVSNIYKHLVKELTGTSFK